MNPFYSLRGLMARTELELSSGTQIFCWTFLLFTHKTSRVGLDVSSPDSVSVAGAVVGIRERYKFWSSSLLQRTPSPQLSPSSS